MFGLGKGDRGQQQVIETLRDGFYPYQNGYAYRPDRHQPAQIFTEQDRDRLVQAYGDGLRRALWVTVPLSVIALGAVVAVAVMFDGEPHAWLFVPLILLLSAPAALMPLRALKRTAAELGSRPRVPADDFAALQREKLRSRPWVDLPLAALIIPLLAWRMKPQVPPERADDYFWLVIIIGLATVIIRTAAKKLIAMRG